MTAVIWGGGGIKDHKTKYKMNQQKNDSSSLHMIADGNRHLV